MASIQSKQLSTSFNLPFHLILFFSRIFFVNCSFCFIHVCCGMREKKWWFCFFLLTLMENIYSAIVSRVPCVTHILLWTTANKNTHLIVLKIFYTHERMDKPQYNTRSKAIYTYIFSVGMSLSIQQISISSKLWFHCNWHTNKDRTTTRKR